MNRREVVATLTLTLVAGKSDAQPRKASRIAFILPTGQIPETDEAKTKIFFWSDIIKELQKLGHIEGQNLTIEWFSLDGHLDRLGDVVAEVVRTKPDVIFALNARIARRLKDETAIIPIVAVTADPLEYGLAETLSRPGGNVTGITTDPGIDIVGKHLELLKLGVPGLLKVGFVAPRPLWDGPYGRRVLQTAEALGLTIIGPPIGEKIDENEYRRVVTAMAKDGAGAILVAQASENSAYVHIVAEVAVAKRLPGLAPYLNFVRRGGLFFYGSELMRTGILPERMARYCDLILRGAKPAELPFQQPTKFELIINMKAAKALKLDLPQSLLSRADEVIE